MSLRPRARVPRPRAAGAEGAALLARRRGRHSGVHAFHAGIGVQGGLRLRARPHVAAPAVLDVREVRGVPARRSARKRPGCDPVLVPAHASRGFRRREAGEAAAHRPAVRAGRRRPSRRAVPGPAGRRLGRGRGSAELGTSRGLPRLRAQRAGRATRKEGSFVGQRLRRLAARALARDPHAATLSARIASPWTGWRPRTRTARVQSRSRETRARAAARGKRCRPRAAPRRRGRARARAREEKRKGKIFH